MTTLVVTLTVDQLAAIIRAIVREEVGHATSDDDLLTREQVAAIMKIHPKLVTKYVRDRGLPAVRLGLAGPKAIGRGPLPGAKSVEEEPRAVWRFQRSDFRRWLEEQAVKPGARTKLIAEKLRTVSGGK